MIAIVDKYMSEQCVKTLELMGYMVVRSFELQKPYAPINTHPDTQVFLVDTHTIICEPSSYNYYSNILPKRITVIKGNTFLGTEYPNDIAYNVAKVGSFLIGKIEKTDKTIKEYVKQNNFTYLNTKQGYSKCNICRISENSILTEDIDILKRCINKGVDVCYIDKGYVKLKNFTYGFIGGASGNVNDIIFFTGKFFNDEIELKVNEFAIKYQKKIFYLSNNPIEDFGSILFLK